MARLSVNVNKVATLRNSRGGREPSVLAGVEACLRAGATGITIHPREDERHIRRDDVFAIAERLAPLRSSVELNIEGDPRPSWVAMVESVRPHQATLVPVLPGEITSQAGWPSDTPIDELGGIVARFRALGIRTSLFVDPEPEAIAWAARLGADRIELYTEPFARAFEQGPSAAAASYATYARAAEAAHALGLGINAGHDLDLDNLVTFRELPHLDEVSIGHAIMARALFVGLETVVREYLALLAG